MPNELAGKRKHKLLTEEIKKRLPAIGWGAGNSLTKKAHPPMAQGSLPG